MAHSIGRLREAAPEEIRDDLVVMEEALIDFTEMTIADLATSDPDSIRADAERMEAAVAEVDRFVRLHCA